MSLITTKTTAVILFSFLLVSSVHPAQTNPSETDLLISEGATLLELGETETAANLFRQALSEDPDNEEAASYLERINADEDAIPESKMSGNESPSELESEGEPFQGHEDKPVPVPFEEQVSGEPQEEQGGTINYQQSTININQVATSNYQPLFSNRTSRPAPASGSIISTAGAWTATKRKIIRKRSRILKRF